MSDTPPSPQSPASPSLPSDPDKLRQPERTFPVQHSDWLKLRQKVDNLREPVPYLAGVGWTCVGLTAGALIGLVAWWPGGINSALPLKAHIHYTFMMPLLIITALAGTLSAAFAFVVWHQVKQLRVTTVKNVLDEMDAIYEPHSHKT